MPENGYDSPRLGDLIASFARTGLGTLQNRGELLQVEWQEEKARMLEVLVLAALGAFLGVLGIGMLTALIIFLVPKEFRLYGLAAFAILYLAGAVIAWNNLKTLLRREPFPESVAQVRKDAACLGSLK